jgi:hypothetical protein
MTDEAYDERDDEREAQEAARGQTERDEEGKACDEGQREPDEDEPAGTG